MNRYSGGGGSGSSEAYKIPAILQICVVYSRENNMQRHDTHFGSYTEWNATATAAVSSTIMAFLCECRVGMGICSIPTVRHLPS